MWQLRHNLSGYDATYVALAEALAASSLVTTDARMATASGIGVPVEML
jgi:predicted nucleic acid-binding protein